MAMRGNAMRPSDVTRSLVCVDRTDNYDISGVFYNPYMKKPVKFASVLEIIKTMERFFDEISFPQQNYMLREFNPKPVTARKAESEMRQYISEEIFNSERGKKATFVIQVQFRQNATWQGIITWTDEKKTRSFRSTLEMLKLMDSALKGRDKKGLLPEEGWKNMAESGF